MISDFLISILATISLVAALLLASDEADAFKVDTHVLIAQEVLNDALPDGTVSFEINDKKLEYRLNDRTLNALQSNPSFFRMGSIGPDALPGIAAGQNVIHPGSENPNRWGTSEWLSHINNLASAPAEVAIAKGFLVHAAADVFAHTYVNHYSGNAWDFSDETHVETRHFVLESFIASKNPPIVDSEGNILGSAASLVYQSSGDLAVPGEFLASTFVFDRSASLQMNDGAPHIRFFYNHRNNVRDAADSARDLVVEIERLFLFYYTGLNLNNKEMRRLRETLNDIRKAITPIDEMRQVADEITKIRVRFAEIPADVIDDLLGELERTYARYFQFRSKFDEAALEAAGIHDDIRSKISTCKAAKKLRDAQCYKTQAVEKIFGKLAGKVASILDPACSKEAERVFNEAKKACDTIESAMKLQPLLNEAISARNKLEQEVLGIADDVRRLADEIEEIMIAKIELDNQLLQAALDGLQLIQEDPNIIVALLEGWEKGINIAVAEYSVANAQAIVNAITDGEDTLAPLSDWVDCHSWTLAGIPHPLGRAKCAIGNAKDDVLDRLTRIADVLSKYSLGSLVAKELLVEIRKVISRIKRELILEALEEITGEPVREYLALFKQPGTTQNITRVFSTGEEVGLKAIPDAAYRIGAEMSLDKDGWFSKERYAVFRNAVILAKLSLLDANSLNELARDLGVIGETNYGETLFNPIGDKGNGVLFGAIRSIDGSYQWRPRGMAFLRTKGHEHPPYGRYTYLNSDDSQNGFRLWVDEKARKAVFRQIFSGPLVPGIDAPHEIGFTPTLEDDYPYRVCSDNPFPEDNLKDDPDTPVDTRCERIAAAEILQIAPDNTREDVRSMKSIHERLADTEIPVSTLTNHNQWLCASEFEGTDKVGLWRFRFTADGKLHGDVAVVNENDDMDGTLWSAVSSSYDLVGDFLFIEPARGMAVIQHADGDDEHASIVRRYTSHLQRYWIDKVTRDALVLQNQDGMALYCGAATATSGN